MIPTLRHPRSTAAGFSLIEALIAAGLLLLVAVGVLPMFAQAIRSNATGQTTTAATNAVRSSFEAFLARSFGDNTLVVETGQTARTQYAYWVTGTDVAHGAARGFWVTATDATLDQRPTAYVSTWRRTDTIRDFQIAPLTDTTDPLAIIPITAPNPLSGGSDPGFIHFKEVEVEMTNLAMDTQAGTSSPIAGSWGQRVRILKAF